MQPLIDVPPPVHSYVPGSWVRMLPTRSFRDYGGWRDPWI